MAGKTRSWEDGSAESDMMPGGAQGYPDSPGRQTRLRGDGKGRTQSEKAGDIGDLFKNIPWQR